MSDRETTRELMERLERHYIKPGQDLPGGIFVPECGRNGGGTGSRCDALYVGFTSTSGRLLIGHEVKVSRADWRKELDTAGKADQWADDCHAWYIVAPSTEIVVPEELPADWGLMIPSTRTKTRMQVVVKATVHKARVPAWATVRSIMARQDTLRAGAIARIRSDALDKARAQLAEQNRQTAHGRLTPEQADRLRALDRLEELIGMTLSSWSNRDGQLTPERLAAGIAIASKAHEIAPKTERYAGTHMRDVAERLLKDLDAWDELVGEIGALAAGRLP